MIAFWNLCRAFAVNGIPLGIVYRKCQFIGISEEWNGSGHIFAGFAALYRNFICVIFCRSVDIVIMTENISAAITVSELSDLCFADWSRFIIINIRIKYVKRLPISKKAHKRIRKWYFVILYRSHRHKSLNINSVWKLSFEICLSFFRQFNFDIDRSFSVWINCDFFRNCYGNLIVRKLPCLLRHINDTVFRNRIFRQNGYCWLILKRIIANRYCFKIKAEISVFIISDFCFRSWIIRI